MTRRLQSALVALFSLVCSPAAFAAAPVTTDTAHVYYYLPYKGWAGADIHHNAGGGWTSVPGQPMAAASCGNWVVKAIPVAPAASFQAVFNNGTGSAWDNPLGGGNYIMGPGIHQVKNGALRLNAGPPCADYATTAQVYYKPNPSWTTVNVHYAPSGAGWTRSPGVAMDGPACAGWRYKSIALGSALGVSVTFNNGSAWDNNHGHNYALGIGISRVENGEAKSGTSPCADITAPTVPLGLAMTGNTSTLASLAWLPSADDVGVTGYDIFESGEPIGASDNPSFVARNLNRNAATHSFTVRARDAAGNVSAPSSPLVVRLTVCDAIGCDDPLAPTGLAVGAVAATSVLLQWAPSTSYLPETYEIYVNGVSAGRSSTTSFVVDHLKPATAYSLTVRALDIRGTLSPPSQELAVTTVSDVASR